MEITADEQPFSGRVRIGIDIGGTFTDFVISDTDRAQVQTFKLLSTPENPDRAVLDGLELIERQYGLEIQDTPIIHGSTVATNALLERKGAKVALLTTRGFKDILKIGRQNRPSLYDFAADPAEPLVPDNRRLEITERIDHFGQVLTPLEEDELIDLIDRLNELEVESVAICLLFSFLHPEHEQVLAEKLRLAGYFVSASVEVLPEYREYERTSTTTVNAYVSPVLSEYLKRLESAVLARAKSEPDQSSIKTSLRVMQSNGGVISPTEASRNGVNCILSGPAGGLIGSRFIARLAAQSSKSFDIEKIITFDMGGTSTDVSLLDGKLQVTTEAVIGGQPISLPMLDIHTIGAGGGSIAQVDLGGALRVGPESAGASPGPACYGFGELPTVTDANLVLGFLSPEHFLGGRMPLVIERATAAVKQLGLKLGLNARQTASGIIEVANAHMERALRVISVERGHDPQDFALLSFGGAGGLHAVNLARTLGIPKALIPPMASTLSAFGMLAADIVKDFSQTVMLPGEIPDEQLNLRIKPLIDRGYEALADEGIPAEKIQVIPMLDVRYQGQSYELTIPYSRTFREDFHRTHEGRYGYARVDEGLEVVNLRVQAIGKVPTPKIAGLPKENPDPSPAFLFHRRVFLAEEGRDIPFYIGEKLRPGNVIQGPAIVLREDTTVLIGVQDYAGVDPYLNLIITIGGE